MMSRPFHIAAGLALLVLAHAATRAAEGPAGGVQDYVVMCREIETTMTTGEGEAFDKYFNLEGFLDIVTVNLEGDFKEGFKNGMRRSMKLGKQMREALGPQGSYKLLRVHSVNGSPRALFR